MWVLAIPGPVPPVAAGEEGPGPLPWRVGGKLGFTVDAAAFPDSSGEVLEVYLRLPPTTLMALAREDSGGARLRVTARLRNRFGARHHEASQEFAVAPSDSGGGFGKVLVLPFPVRSGGYRMQVRLEDMLSHKRGLAYLGRHVTRSAAIEGDVEVPGPQDDRRLSNIEFVWSEAGARAAAVFRHAESPASLLPNPDRLYGLLASGLQAQFSAHAPRGDPRPWSWKASVIDREGHVVATRESTAAPSRWLIQSVAMDVSTEPAGAYDLEVRVWQEGDARPMVQRGRFSIAWQQATWLRGRGEIEDEAHLLLDAAEDEDRFSRLSPGEQERYLEDFWRERDPSPGTAENEVRTEYFRRVEHANRTWNRSGIDRGMFTDMGRVYIRHGEPDEILRQVIPAGDQTLDQLLQQLELTENRPTGDVHSKGLGGDVRPFEVWIYEGIRSRPITAKPDPGAAERSVRRLLFLFVDEYGYGDYRLRYTTE